MKDLLLGLLQNPFVLATLSGLVAFLFMFVDTKITKSYRNNSTYYKNTGLVSGLVGLSIYLSKNGLNKLFKKNELTKNIDNVNKQESNSSTNNSSTNNNINNTSNTNKKGIKVNEDFYELESDDDFDN